MPLYEIDADKMIPVQHKTFIDVDLKERQHLQALLRDNPSAIAKDIMIIAEEFSYWLDSTRRIDLLALDKACNLVVIEIKRVENDSHMELQAIRYAAMISAMDFDTVVTTYESFLRARNESVELARSTLLKFLEAKEDEIEITNTPRIILISPSFAKEITTTVLWLNQQTFDIKCIQTRPYKIQDKLYLDMEQVIPLPAAESYLVSLGKKNVKAERQAANKRRETSVEILQAAGILKPGTRLTLLKAPRSGMTISDENATKATFAGDEGFRWAFDQQIYSLSNLCKRICEEFGADGSGAFAGPDYWALEGDGESLYQKAKQIQTGKSPVESI